MVKRGKRHREINLGYSYDRLSSERIMQAYKRLVPEKIWQQVYADDSLGEKLGGLVDEVGSDMIAWTYDWTGLADGVYDSLYIWGETPESVTTDSTTVRRIYMNDRKGVWRRR